jgi:hypothetical protein
LIRLDSAKASLRARPHRNDEISGFVTFYEFIIFRELKPPERHRTGPLCKPCFASHFPPGRSCIELFLLNVFQRESLGFAGTN